MADAVLVLEDGRVFEGRASGAEGTTFGEVVFNTGMSGYEETLTDPSYRGQIVVMTASHVGNYGVTDDDAESSRIQVAGFAARHFPRTFSNPRGRRALPDALRDAGIVAIDELDTRALVRHLRSRGAMRGAISSETRTEEDRKLLLSRVLDQPQMAGAALALTAGSATAYHFGAVRPRVTRIAALDIGIKRNILKMLTARGLDATVVPAGISARELLAGGYDGFFLSNGPGDPEALPTAVETVKALVDSGKPVFGICLGHQLLGLALGAKTFKLKFGHRGANHPVKCLVDGSVAITSQNHGFSVDAATLPREAELTHVNLNDGTCEGFRVKDRPVFAVQYHPESAPGPHDSDALFDQYAEMLKRRD
jgi:carbamoyl-phosphate synthase small subunit